MCKCREEFCDFYSNKKGSNTSSQNTQLSAQDYDVTTNDATKVEQNSDNAKNSDENSAKEFSVKADKELEKITDNAKADCTYMKAPNGKPSKLDEKQWALVRTDAFKNWFGDWELANLHNRASTAWNNKDSKGKAVFGLSLKAKTRFKELLGSDTKQLIITDDAIRHIKQKHGEREELRGQKNLTPDDIAVIPYIVNNFDSMELEPKYNDRKGNRAITIKKRINGVSVVATIEKGKEKEFLVTSYQYIKSDALDASMETSRLNVQNDSDIANVQKEIEFIKNVAKNSSQVVDDNGEPLVVDDVFLNIRDNNPINNIQKDVERARKFVTKIRQIEEKTGEKYNTPNFWYSKDADALSEELMRMPAYIESIAEGMYYGANPTIRVAFRYGDINEQMRSYNYRDNMFEKGVSVVGRVADMNTDKNGYYDAFFGNEPYNVVLGVDFDAKGADGKRSIEKPVNNKGLIHRFYGSTSIDGKLYRVKQT